MELGGRKAGRVLALFDLYLHSSKTRQVPGGWHSKGAGEAGLTDLWQTGEVPNCGCLLTSHQPAWMHNQARRMYIMHACARHYAD